MERQTTLSDAQFTERLREALEPVLPYGPSLIPLDILVVIATANDAGQPITVKQLMAVLPYSATGIRYNLSQLIADGWVTKSRSGSDRRLVQLEPAVKVAAAFADVRAEVMQALH